MRTDNPYLAENLRPDMPNQEELMSCSAACARKLLADCNAETPESEIRALAKFHPTEGIEPPDLASALNILQPTWTFCGGCVFPRAGQSLEDAARLLSSKGPWIANLQMPGRHSVIVVAIKKDVVNVLDPWGLNGPGSACGTSATISMKDFLQRWQPSLHAIFRT
jgi:hypothetical protein